MTNSPDDGSALPFIYVAVPAMDEAELLPRLLECIALQGYRSFKLVVCVNQPEAWHCDPQKSSICQSNAATLQLLHGWNKFQVEVIDRSSPGAGWVAKRHGVGWARKTIMDKIAREAAPGDIILSLDADTVFSPNYFLSVATAFSRNPDAVAMAVPYFHRKPDDLVAYRAILRYEIYMRHYLLNMIRIGSPYTFSALGSALACTVRAYKTIGGMSPKISGEDFYFLQKLRKYGPVLIWNDEHVYPEARFSDRVFFGTGPAMIKGDTGDWTSYPIYSAKSFNEIMETMLLFPVFYFKTLKTKVNRFLAKFFAEKDPWKPLRENHADLDHFMRACHEKLDGLRILQYLKAENSRDLKSDEQRLYEWMVEYYDAKEVNELNINWKKFSFAYASAEELEAIRTFLFAKEMEARFNSALE